MSAYPFHIPDSDEACEFCTSQHTGRIIAWDNSGKYTRSYYITFCDEHKEQAEAKKLKIKSKKYVGNMWD
jgi:alpha-D-ribose 1-methylphosphonate 5-phosphate C-P lyase